MSNRRSAELNPNLASILFDQFNKLKQTGTGLEVAKELSSRSQFGHAMLDVELDIGDYRLVSFRYTPWYRLQFRIEGIPPGSVLGYLSLNNRIEAQMTKPPKSYIGPEVSFKDRQIWTNKLITSLPSPKLAIRLPESQGILNI